VRVKPVGENAFDDVFGWAAREPGRVTFARQAGSEWVPAGGKPARRAAARSPRSPLPRQLMPGTVSGMADERLS
jgi:hypothetical protein